MSDKNPPIKTLPSIKALLSRDLSKPHEIKFTVTENLEDGSIPDYDADILQGTKEADKYRGRSVSYEPPDIRSYTSLTVLPQLNGRPWDQFALNMIHSLRPSSIRVNIGGGGIANASRWRVTVALEEDDRTIREITQEVEVACVGAKHGHGLRKYEIGADPKPALFYCNPNGLKRLKLTRDGSAAAE